MSNEDPVPSLQSNVLLAEHSTRFNGLAHSGVAGALGALPSIPWLGGCKGRKEK